jgi:hypothetical protein
LLHCLSVDGQPSLIAGDWLGGSDIYYFNAEMCVELRVYIAEGSVIQGYQSPSGKSMNGTFLLIRAG